MDQWLEFRVAHADRCSNVQEAHLVLKVRDNRLPSVLHNGRLQTKPSCWQRNKSEAGFDFANQHNEVALCCVVP